MGVREKVANLISPRKPSNIGIYTDVEMRDTGSKVVVDSRTPLSMKTTPEIKRVSEEFLEAAYRSEPNVFNAVNKTAQLIMAAGYKLIGDRKSVAFFDNFFDSIGSRGGELEWEELLNSIFRHQLIYGEAWNELIPAKRDEDKIVDLDLIDPKKMDYAKTNDGKIVLDKFGDPVGYVETLPYDYTIEQIRFAPPETVAVQANQIFFPPDKLAHYKLYTLGDGFYGIGLIEPSYKTIVRKLNMEEALANAVHRTGFPIRYAQVGDLNHEPTEEMMQRTVERLRNTNYMDVIVYPNWVESGIVEAKRPEKLQEHLSYYIGQIVTGTGLPNALVTGLGEQTNRSTLNRQEALTKRTLEDIVRRTVRVIHKRIIEPVAISNKVNPVKILWGKISIEELDGKAKRLGTYVSAGLLTSDERIEDLIRKVEDLPERGAVGKKDSNPTPKEAKPGK